MGSYAGPLPLITQISKVFYDGCREGRLLYQQCTSCGELVFFPKLRCTGCLGDTLAWKDSSGIGSIFSFTITREQAPSEFASMTPYVLAIIRLNEGFKMMSNIVECNLDELHCGMDVEVVFEAVTPEISLPKFRPHANMRAR